MYLYKKRNIFIIIFKLSSECHEKEQKERKDEGKAWYRRATY